MRLRLDKLVLSAGLALAMVATTIPVGASVTTTTTTTNGTSVTTVVGAAGYATSDGTAITADGLKGLMAAISGVSTADTTGVATGVSGVTKKDALATGLDNPTDSLVTDGVATTAYINAVDSEYTFGTGSTVASDTGAFEQVTTYTVSGYEYTSTEALATTDAAASAALTAIKTALKIENGENSYSTYTVQVTDGTKSATTDAAMVEEKYPAKSVFTVSGTFTVTKTYTITALPEGYRYDIVLDKEATSNYEYKVAYNEGTTNKEYTNITDCDDGIVVSLTKLSGTYYLGKKQVSASGNLLFAPTEGNDADTDVVVTSGEYTATITKNAAANGADYTLAEDAPESATVAGYFKIALTKGGTDVTKGPSITFKIAVPTDVTASEGKQIKWQVVRVHDYDDGNGDTVELLSATEENGYIVFSSEYFSNFALIYTEVAADTTTTEETTDSATDSTTDSATDSTTDATTDSTSATTADSSTTSTTASEKTGDNSMMPLFMTTLLLALCAGSLAIYKEKKTN